MSIREFSRALNDGTAPEPLRRLRKLSRRAVARVETESPPLWPQWLADGNEG